MKYLHLGYKIAFLLIIFVAPLSFAVKTDAVGTPFGGKITRVRYCNCSLNWRIEYIPVKSGMPSALSFRDGISILYQYGQIRRPGAIILGTASGPDPCIYGHKCHHKKEAELIQIVGTSR